MARRPPPISTPGVDEDTAAGCLRVESMDTPQSQRESKPQSLKAALQLPGMMGEDAGKQVTTPASMSASSPNVTTPSKRGKSPNLKVGFKKDEGEQAASPSAPSAGGDRTQTPAETPERTLASPFPLTLPPGATADPDSADGTDPPAPPTPSRPRPQPLTFDAPQDKAFDFYDDKIKPCHEFFIRLSQKPGEAQQKIEAYFRKMKDGNTRAAVEIEFKRAAIKAGDLLASSAPGDEDIRPKPGEMSGVRFNASQILDVFKARRPHTSRGLLADALAGRISWRRMAAIILRRVLLLGFFVLLLNLLLALLIYGTAKDVTVNSSGALLDPVTQGPVSTAATVKLHALWDFPKLQYSDLRRVEDVVFVHNAATHVLRVAVVEKDAESVIIIKANDGDMIRIEHSGRAYWQRVGHPEVHLSEMEAWREMGLDSDPEVAWLTSGVLSTQVTMPSMSE